MGEAKAVVWLDSLLEIIKLANSAETRGEIIIDDSKEKQQLKWKLKSLKDSLGSVIKLLD